MKKYRKKNLNVMSVNTLTLILSIIFLTIGFNIQEKYSFFGTLITEVFIVLLPALLIAKTGNFKEVLKLKKTSVSNILFSILVVILAYPIILLLNGIFLSLLSNFIEYKNYPMEIMLQNVPIFNYLIFMCIVPAICEEIFFRGTLTNAYSIYGSRFAIAMSAIVFALFHFDIQNFVAPLLLGLLFSTLIEITDSIFPAMVAHFINNVIAVFTVRYVNDGLFQFLSKTKISREIGSLQLFFIIILIIISIFSVILIRIIFKKMKENSSQNKDVRIRYRDVEAIDFFNFVPIIALVILYFIYHYIVF
ncbi:CPBP family glutamic-type intramembrane protease [Peptoniphilus sp.]|jgi:membrane protease YdiL (CAAX protease family)|uniref:CPBP family glutamic-type intramembrane protease n=1 Tax=Peptoniphilus sp. TaxID=1971214 RepID=UPI003D8F7FE1